MFRRLLDLIQRKKILRLKKRYLFILVFVILILLSFIIIYSLSFNTGNIEYGMTFSHKYAKELGIDYQDTFVNLVDDLNIKKFRMMAYWDDIESLEGVYDFTELDWLIRRADYSNADVILVVGRRQPRWPECHQPAWVEDLTRVEQMKEELAMIKTVVNHFKIYGNIIAWQVENEPFLSVFGECPETTDEFYVEKLNLVRSLDNRPTIMTDSGELSTWRKPANLNPILGSSIYRYVWNPLYGNFIYPLPPAYYNFKAKALYKTTQLREVFISELQLEPWTSKAIIDVSLDDQFKSMNINRFKDSIRYAKRIGFDNIYLWGGEWWYWLKIIHGDDSFWLTAKELINE